MEHLDCIVYTNAIFEEEKALCVNGRVVVIGDAYHDKIDSVIEGFFYGLDYIIANGAQYSYTKTEKTINAMLQTCDFYSVRDD
jgi:hypothetical protein